jgi:hypothetical protein
MKSGHLPVKRNTPFKSKFVLLACLGVALAVPQAANAQSRGIFGALFGMLSGAPPISHSRPPLAYADPSSEPSANPTDRSQPTSRPGRGLAFCVRMCDGRYFPVTMAGGSAPESTCNAMCPAAKTKIFWGSQSGPSVGSDGTGYTDTDNAYVYRDKTVDGCTCNGKTSYGLVAIDVKNDSTLRRGDMVATSEGVKVFNGNTRVGHRAADFDLAVNYTRLPSDVRRHLATMSVTPAGDSAERR